MRNNCVTIIANLLLFVSLASVNDLVFTITFVFLTKPSLIANLLLYYLFL